MRDILDLTLFTLLDVLNSLVVDLLLYRFFHLDHPKILMTAILETSRSSEYNL
jgi:hypothetical protein